MYFSKVSANRIHSGSPTNQKQYTSFIERRYISVSWLIILSICISQETVRFSPYNFRRISRGRLRQSKFTMVALDTHHDRRRSRPTFLFTDACPLQMSFAKLTTRGRLCDINTKPLSQREPIMRKPMFGFVKGMPEDYNVTQQ